jgi:hypothetical protein
MKLVRLIFWQQKKTVRECRYSGYREAKTDVYKYLMLFYDTVSAAKVVQC